MLILVINMITKLHIVFLYVFSKKVFLHKNNKLYFYKILLKRHYFYKKVHTHGIFEKAPCSNYFKN